MDDDSNVINFDAELRKMKNLKPYQNKTDEELREILVKRREKKDISEEPKGRKKKSDEYDERFNEKLTHLQTEFALDMNSSNDVESLKLLVRLQIQNENLSDDIDDIQRLPSRTSEDYRNLKNLGDVQAGVVRSINELQDKLGINRKQRKEKAEDDIPQFITGLLDKAKREFDAKTTVIYCPKCQIELYRFWLNFPQMENKMDISLTCWKCKEQILYAR